MKQIAIFFFFVNFGDSNWWRAQAWIVLLAGAIEVNALAQGALQQVNSKEQLSNWNIKHKQKNIKTV